MDLIKSTGNWKEDRDYFTKFTEEDRAHDRRAIEEARKKGPGVFPSLKCDSTARGVVLDVRPDSLTLLLTTLAEDWLTFDVFSCPVTTEEKDSVVWEGTRYGIARDKVTVEASLAEDAAEAEWTEIYGRYGLAK